MGDGLGPVARARFGLFDLSILEHDPRIADGLQTLFRLLRSGGRSAFDVGRRLGRRLVEIDFVH